MSSISTSLSKDNALFPIVSTEKKQKQNESIYEKMKAFLTLFYKTPLSNVTATAPSQPSLKRVILMGIHGWFPMKLILRFTGPPTGTSSRLCRMLYTSLVQNRDETSKVMGLEDGVILECVLIPLVGEGRLHERLDRLLDQLLDPSLYVEMSAEERQLLQVHPQLPLKEGSFSRWEALQQADVIFMAAHSQGTPVSMHLLARLLHRKILDPLRQRIGLITLAGIHHGPFANIQQNLVVRYVEAYATRELFTMMNTESDTWRQYQASVQYVLQAGVRITCIAGWMDPVVPLYSALMHACRHPNIHRALFVDATSNENDFRIALTDWCLKRRNASCHIHHDSHDILVHLSEFCAGAFYTGNGHSLLYNEPQCYFRGWWWMWQPFEGGVEATWHLSSLALEGASSSDPLTPMVPWYAMESVPVLPPPTPWTPGPTRPNPFLLPWLLRGHLTEHESEQLRLALISWRPVDQKSRLLAYRLEGLCKL